MRNYLYIVRPENKDFSLENGTNTHHMEVATHRDP